MCKGRTLESNIGGRTAIMGVLPGIAAELTRLPLAVLVAGGGEPSALAAKAASATVPIIFLIGGDPVKAGLTASVNRPGTNATGISFVTAELGGKRVNLISELVPMQRPLRSLLIQICRKPTRIFKARAWGRIRLAVGSLR